MSLEAKAAEVQVHALSPDGLADFLAGFAVGRSDPDGSVWVSERL
jgi:hypothetical protein